MLFGRFNYLDLLYNIPAVLICITVHEFSHGFVAYRLGDLTAKQAGRLSLNPLRHIDPIGFLCLILFRFGWAKPVPVSFGYLRNPKRDMALIAAAGPISNILLAFCLMVVLAFMSVFSPDLTVLLILYRFLYITALISIGLAVFNLIPVPPLDGSRIFLPLLPQRAQAFFINNGQVVQIIIIVLLFFGFLSGPISFLIGLIFNGMSALISFIFHLFGLM